MSIRERPFCDCLCNCGLPRSGQPVKPVDGSLVEVPGPVFDRVKNSDTRALETAVTVTMSILCSLGAAEIVEDSRLGCRRLMSGMCH